MSLSKLHSLTLKRHTHFLFLILLATVLSGCGSDEPEQEQAAVVEPLSSPEPVAVEPLEFEKLDIEPFEAPTFTISEPGSQTAYGSVDRFVSYISQPFSDLLAYDFDQDGVLSSGDVAEFAKGIIAKKEYPVAYDLNADGEVNDVDVLGLYSLTGEQGKGGGWGLLDTDHNGIINKEDYEIDMRSQEAFVLLTGDPSITIPADSVAKLRLKSGANPSITSLRGAAGNDWQLVLRSPAMTLAKLNDATYEKVISSVLTDDATHNFDRRRFWSLSLSGSGKEVPVKQVIIDLGNQLNVAIETEQYLGEDGWISLPNYLVPLNGDTLIPRINNDTSSSNAVSLLDFFISAAQANNHDSVLRMLLNPKEVAFMLDAKLQSDKLTVELQKLITEWQAKDRDCYEISCKDFKKLQEMLKPLLEETNAARILAKGMLHQHKSFMNNLGKYNSAIQDGVDFHQKMAWTLNRLKDISDWAVMDWSKIETETIGVLKKKLIKKTIGSGSRHLGEQIGGGLGRDFSGVLADSGLLITEFRPNGLVGIDKDLFRDEARTDLNKKHLQGRAAAGALLGVLKIYAQEYIDAEQQMLDSARQELRKALLDYQRYALLESAYDGFHRLANKLNAKTNDMQVKLEVLEARCKTTLASAQCSSQLEKDMDKAQHDYDAYLKPYKTALQEASNKLDKGYSDSSTRLNKIREVHSELRKLREQGDQEGLNDSERLTLERSVAALDEEIKELRQQQKSGVDATSTITLLAQKKLDYQARIKKLLENSKGNELAVKIKEKQKILEQLWAEQNKWLTDKKTIKEQYSKAQASFAEEMGKAATQHSKAVEQARKKYDQCLAAAVKALNISREVDIRDRSKQVMQEKIRGKLLTISEIFAPVVNEQKRFLKALIDFNFTYKNIKDCEEKQQGVPGNQAAAPTSGECWFNIGDNFSGDILIEQKGRNAKALVSNSLISTDENLDERAINEDALLSFEGTLKDNELHLEHTYTKADYKFLRDWINPEISDKFIKKLIDLKAKATITGTIGDDPYGGYTEETSGYPPEVMTGTTLLLDYALELKIDSKCYHEGGKLVYSDDKYCLFEGGDFHYEMRFPAQFYHEGNTQWLKLDPIWTQAGYIMLFNKTFEQRLEPQEGDIKLGDRIWIEVQGAHNCRFRQDEVTVRIEPKNNPQKGFEVTVQETSRHSGIYRSGPEGVHLNFHKRDVIDENDFRGDIRLYVPQRVEIDKITSDYPTTITVSDE